MVRSAAATTAKRDRNGFEAIARKQMRHEGLVIPLREPQLYDHQRVLSVLQFSFQPAIHLK
jgi:hypothetical protein